MSSSQSPTSGQPSKGRASTPSASGTPGGSPGDALATAGPGSATRNASPNSPTAAGRAPASPTRPPEDVPAGLRIAAAWSWRILVVLLLVSVAAFVTVSLQVLFVALFVALLITALIHPATERLRGWGVPHILATVLVLVGFVAGVIAVLYFAGRSLAGQAETIGTAVTEGFDEVTAWAQRTFGISLDQVSGSLGSLSDGLGGAGEGIASSAFGFASTALEVLGGAGIALFATIFFVHDGAGIWAWLTRLFPRSVRERVDDAGQLSWSTLSSYARGTVLIAAIDAVGIGVGVALIGVPLAGAIGVLVFFGAFIPIVGALVSGAVAVLVALATVGWTAALAVAAIVLIVQQVEGQILQPLIQGKMVSLHPLAVVLAVAAGSILAGLVGAVIAVPVVAVANVLVRYAAEVRRELRMEHLAQT
ncbi:MAG: AI-2E family transporter [Candidatus Nanopelagicales bacterium]